MTIDRTFAARPHCHALAIGIVAQRHSTSPRSLSTYTITCSSTPPHTHGASSPDALTAIYRLIGLPPPKKEKHQPMRTYSATPRSICAVHARDTPPAPAHVHLHTIAANTQPTGGSPGFTATGLLFNEL